ncbi:hypothetical protein AHAS_Ahas02G0142700 [Arachis hypogaea]
MTFDPTNSIGPTSALHVNDGNHAILVNSQIYIPIYVSYHWYLMAVDIWDVKIIYCDSLKPTKEKAHYLEVLLEDSRFYENKETSPPIGFKIRFCRTPNHGIACEIVNLTNLYFAYSVHHGLYCVLQDGLMTIAVDLVMGKHNTISEVVARAVKH